MANRKISDLTALTATAVGDLLPIVDISEATPADKNKKITVEKLFQGIPGNVGIGTSAPGANHVVHIEGNRKYVAIYPNTGQDAGALGLVNPSQSAGLFLGWNRSNGNGEVNIVYGTGVGSAPGLQIASWDGTTYTERMRIGQNGQSLFRTNANNNNPTIAAYSDATSGFSDAIVDVNFAGYTPNNATAKFAQFRDTTVVRTEIRSNGGLANYQANNVNLSDRNAKKNISLSSGTWNYVKEWEIVNYRYKDQPDDADLNLGVIAQQVAESCPEIITVFQEAKEATETEPAQEERLGVKEQQMYWMAIKALQEAQTRIETLEANNADMLARLSALEGA